MSTGFTRHTTGSAEGESLKLLQQIEKNYGFVPELFSYMAESPVALKAYMQLDGLLQDATLGPAQIQIALLTASTVNDCDFCQVAHHAMARQSGVDRKTIDTIRAGRIPEDGKEKALVNMVRAMIGKRGWLEDEDISAFLDAGFTREQIYELLVAVSIKTLSNYSNHLTHPEPNPELVEMTRE
jgi:uncharacterized peroxidase-related enzyme